MTHKHKKMCINRINDIRYRKGPTQSFHLYIYLKIVITKLEYTLAPVITMLKINFILFFFPHPPMLKINFKWQKETGLKDVHKYVSMYILNM